MPPAAFTETSRQSWFSRLGGAFKGILFGLVLFLLSFIFLFWNEGRAVERYKSLQEGAGVVVSVAADRVDPAHEGKLVHLTGPAKSDELLADDDFGVYVRAIHLDRKVEMYQWREEVERETKKKVGGGTETTSSYSYAKAWSDRLVDSSAFKVPAGHQNPPAMPYEARRVSAQRVTVGAFRLSPELIDRMGRIQPLQPDPERLPAALRGKARLEGDGLFIGRDPAAPAIGDLRVSFQVVAPDTVSLVAQQTGDTFRAYQARAGGTVELLVTGTAAADAMFAAAQQSNRVLTWVFRLLGFLLMAVGLRMVLKPLSVLADVLPLLGNLAETASGMFAFLVAALLSLVTIAIAWLFYRPLLALALLALAGGVVIGLVALARRVRRGMPAPAPPG